MIVDLFDDKMPGRCRRSVMFTRPRWRSGSPHITSLFLAVDGADDDAPLCSQARCRACCHGPLLTPCFASCSSLWKSAWEHF